MNAGSRRSSTPLRSVTTLLLCVMLLQLLLLFPGHPEKLSMDNWAKVPLELPALLLLLLAGGRRAGHWLAILATLLLTLLLLLRLADLGSYLAFNRRFSPLLELHLLKDGWNLASTTIGPAEAGLVALTSLCLLMALSLLLFTCFRTISHLDGNTRSIALWSSLLLLAGGTLGLQMAQAREVATPLQAQVLPEYASRITNVQRSIVDQKAFVSALASDTVLDVAQPDFSALAGRDVILIFVESYGRSYLEAEHLRQSSQARLQSVEDVIGAAGLRARSGWLSSPIRGGRSWLAHSTLQSGLQIDNQARYDRLLSTDRQSLTRLFGSAGWRTVGVMPAIQTAWPEGSWYGFDELYTQADLAYAGQRFGYVTMPDQYTLTHFQDRIRSGTGEPVMATIALLSTHAPWTPLPQKIDWDLVGDGSIFDGSNRFGEPVSWKFRKRVQDLYRQSFDYTLDVLGEYLARSADDALFIIVGDHQPPPVIDGWASNADVPIHIASRDTSLLERLPARYWTTGMLPDGTVQSLPMQDFRQVLVSLFSDESSSHTAASGISPDSPRSRL